MSYNILISHNFQNSNFFQIKEIKKKSRFSKMLQFFVEIRYGQQESGISGLLEYVTYTKLIVLITPLCKICGQFIKVNYVSAYFKALVHALMHP